MTSPFALHIDKNTIQALPLTSFEGEVIIVDLPEKVQEAVEYLSQFTILGVDTEARPSFKRGVHYPTALVQVATLERCYLFRLTHVGLPKELADILANPNLKLIANSPEAGASIVMARGGREFFITGHLEYAPYPPGLEKVRCPVSPVLYRWRPLV